MNYCARRNSVKTFHQENSLRSHYSFEMKDDERRNSVLKTLSPGRNVQKLFLIEFGNTEWRNCVYFSQKETAAAPQVFDFGGK